MAEPKTGKRRRGVFSNLMRGARLAILRTNPAKVLVIGYVGYMLAGWLLLSMPFAHETSVPVLDNLFTSVSAVSTDHGAVPNPV